MTSVGARTGLLAHLERPLPGWITNGHDLPRKELKVRLNTGMDAQALESLAITHGPFFSVSAVPGNCRPDLQNQKPEHGRCSTSLPPNDSDSWFHRA